MISIFCFNGKILCIFIVFVNIIDLASSAFINYTSKNSGIGQDDTYAEGLTCTGNATDWDIKLDPYRRDVQKIHSDFGTNAEVGNGKSATKKEPGKSAEFNIEITTPGPYSTSIKQIFNNY
ncbi:Hypothetical protein CINCED_3A025663 [Cinara cedri]|uniref:Uncharacterized protein n=1 Tax=Cinara cedri TaxID=506608 RepID=A0A5E4NQM8_9HEMI|nr:Hypothetical protein CINCED_3A025663 [Cinara cedri]